MFPRRCGGSTVRVKRAGDTQGVLPSEDMITTTPPTKRMRAPEVTGDEGEPKKKKQKRSLPPGVGELLLAH